MTAGAMMGCAMIRRAGIRRAGRCALRSALGALLILVVLDGGKAALGQDQPLSLFPAVTDQPSSPTLEGQAVEGAPTTAVGESATPSRQGIEVDALAGPDPASTGIMGSGQGGFSADVWRGSRRGAVTALLSRVRGALASPVMRGSLVRLLLTSAAAPAREGDRAEIPPAQFLAARVGALMSLGAPEQVLELVARVPRTEQGEAVMRWQAEALLAAGSYDDACRLIDQEIVAYHAEAFWGRGLVFCQIRRSEVDQAMLGLDLLRETGADDPLFSALAFHFAGGDMQDAPVGEVSALHVAMMRLMNMPPSDEVVAAAPHYLWGTLLAMEGLEAAQRADLGERAAAVGIVSPAGLATVYGELSVPAPALAAALSTDPDSSNALDRALLFQAATAESLDIARAEALQRLLQSAGLAGRYGVVMAAALPLLERLQPRADLSWFAASAARAFFIDGQLERARAWLRLAELDAEGGLSSPDLRRSLYPFLLFHGSVIDDAPGGFAVLGAGPTTNEALTGAPSLEAEDDRGAEEMARATALLAALTAAGAELDDDWSDLAARGALTPGQPVDGPLILALDEAAATARPGEAMLLAAALIGGRSLDALTALEVDAILRAFRAIGLEEEARLLGIEVALANGY
jgi:hypothetical protein